MLEKTLENKIVKSLLSMDIIALKFVSPGHPGVPDRICVGDSGLCFFVEVKQKGEKLKPAQHRSKRRLENKDFKVWVIDSQETLDIMLEYYAKNKKRPT